MDPGRPAKKRKVESEVPQLESLESRCSEGCSVLTLGQGDTGQLGLGEDIMERTKATLVKELRDVVDICAGGMHTVCLDEKGEVYTFGCNDEGALGRKTENEEDYFTAGKVDLTGRIVQISAGDSHTVALNDKGKVFYWGTFRDGNGSFGLTPKGEIEVLPVPLAHDLYVCKIASGADHVVLLTSKGELFTLGRAEQGQLGRVAERFVARGARRGLDLLLRPERVRANSRKIVFEDVWAGSYNTYALTSSKEVYVCGLNNYNQLGIEKGQLFFTLNKSISFSEIGQAVGFQSIAVGQHHALALDKAGRTYSVGRVEYGRLGLGKEVTTDASIPTLIPGLPNAVDVSCGTAVSFAVTKSGDVFSWGMGTNGQLGQAEEEEDAWLPKKMVGKQLETRKVMRVSGGGQHTVLLAKDKKDN